MHLKLDVELVGKAQALATLHKLSSSQINTAYARALNDAAYQARRAMQAEMKLVFDRPTNYVLRSPRVREAQPTNLVAHIEPTYGGGKGIDPQRILSAQTHGGRRRDKRLESALRRAGILPAGMQTAIPAQPFPGSDDGRGNLRGSFVVQLMSYFHTFGEQGYRANMTDKRRANIHRGTAAQAGRRYFVAYGGMRGGARTTRQGEFDRRASNLAPGIWAATGTGGVDVRPVVMFVATGHYRPRLDMDKVAQRAGLAEYLPRRMRYQIRKEAGV